MYKRQVKYSVAELNKEYGALILSSNKGYKIDKLKAAQILSFLPSQTIPASYEERKRYIINTLLLQNQRMSISDLSDKLCISPITLQNELSRMRTDLMQFHLNIHTKNDMVNITGLAKDKRAVILSLINEEIKSSYFSLERIQEIFTSVSLARIKQLILQVMHKYEYFLDDYSLLNYVLHIALTVELRSSNPARKFNASRQELVSHADMLNLASAQVQKMCIRDSFSPALDFQSPPAPAPRVQRLRSAAELVQRPAPESARLVSGFPRFPASRFHSGGRRSYCREPDAEDNPNIAAGLL